VTTVWRGRRIGLSKAERTADFNQCATETWLCVEACDNEAVARWLFAVGSAPGFDALIG
jgi:hypothetical protein